MSGNFEGQPWLKHMRVSAGDFSQVYTYDVRANNTSRRNMQWVQHKFEFAATNTWTTLQFASETSVAGWGATIDDVSVQVVPEPTSVAILGLSTLALVLRQRRSSHNRY